MKKNKTALTTIKHPDTSFTSLYLSSSSTSFLSQSTALISTQISQLQQQQSQTQTQLLIRKNKLLQKQLLLLKQSKQSLQKQLQAYRKVFLNKGKGDIHQILQMQHNQIFELKTSLEILEGKYWKLLSKNGSNAQTQYAIKCKMLEQRLRNREIQYQKEIAGLKSKIMKMSASQIYQNNNNNNNMSNMSNMNGNNNMNMSSSYNYINNNGRLSTGNSTMSNSNSKQLQPNMNTVITPMKNSRRLV